jgi:hypothetical protein
MKTKRVNKRKDKFDVDVTRQGGEWGNRFIIGRDGTREEVVFKHRLWLIKHPKIVKRARKRLKGKRLACVCGPDQQCHGDNLVDAAEGRLYRDHNLINTDASGVPPRQKDDAVLTPECYYYLSNTGTPGQHMLSKLQCTNAKQALAFGKTNKVQVFDLSESKLKRIV